MKGALVLILLGIGLGWHPVASFAQATDFQIVWVTIGEAATGGADGQGRVGRRLFTANDVASLSLRKVRVQRVDVQPAVTELAVGARVCLDALKLLAVGTDKQPIKAAPLTIAVRQDHRERLHLERSASNVCVQPSAAGEYPIRFNSLLPADDGTTRGAQIFLRVTTT